MKDLERHSEFIPHVDILTEFTLDNKKDNKELSE